MTESSEYWAAPTPPEGTKEAWSNEANTPLPPEGVLGKAWFNRIVVMPMSPPKKSAGGILFTDDYIHDQTYLSYVGRIASIGNKAFKSKRFEALRFSDEDMPRVGQWWLFDIYQMRRYERTIYEPVSSITSDGPVESYKVKLLILNEESLLLPIPDNADPWDFRLIR